MDFTWEDLAYQVGVSVGQDGPKRRRRWQDQDEYDAEYMHTECTRFNRARDEELRQCCKEAGVTRYALIGHLLRAWMASWHEYQATHNRGV